CSYTVPSASARRSGMRTSGAKTRVVYRATLHVERSLPSGHGGGLRLHAFPRGRGPLDGVDDLVAPDGVGEVRHGARPVVDVFNERCISAPDVVCRRSF